ncbi:UNVERIFIED_CONTAM: hypothetical protein Cloal_4273 [Acetivibrio alkalicellulosi]
MEALRKVVNGADLPSIFELPENVKKRKLEVIIIPMNENEEIDLKLNAIDKLHGLLSNDNFLIEEFDLIISKRLSC